jgi:methylated-DNA-[protein]-cysteine S-methyltransferase
MSRTHPTCREIEPDLVAVATGEGTPRTAQLVEAHVAQCPPCREEFQHYRAVEGLVADLKSAPVAGGDPTLARAELESRLADLRSRVVNFGIFSSPLGPILIARTEHGVSLVEYLESETARGSRLSRLVTEAAIEDESKTEGLFRDLLDYLEGGRTRLEWPLDLRWARGEFQRRVLQATSRLPYGAVTSYAGIAREIGAPTAPRAVAQALRWNPIPIVIPCHRVIGHSGDLTGYAGDKITLKQRLLAVEGVRTVAAHDEFRVDRRVMYVRYLTEVEYCLPTCGSLSSTPLSQLTLFGSRDRAEAVGLAPCSSCRPDLHPIASA